MKLQSPIVVGIAALFAACIALAVTLADPPKYQEDGYNYAVAMQMDRGASFDIAIAQASAFYRDLPAARDPELARRLGHAPEYWNLFRVRVIVPFVASLIAPFAGFAALPDVSRAGFVLTAALMVLLLVRFVPVSWAFVASVGMLAVPAWRDIGRSALTDALGVALVTASVIAALRMLDRPSLPRVAALAVLIGAVTFTRPIPYIFVGGGIALIWWALAMRDRRVLRAGAILAGIALAWTIAVGLAAIWAHAPGLAWIVADAYRHMVAGGYARAGQPLPAWYLSEELRIAARAGLVGVLTMVPVAALAGLWIGRRRADLWLLGGCIAGSALGALLNPSRFDVIRCVVLPVAPMIAACAAYAAFAGAGHLAQGLRSQSARRNVSGRPLRASRSME